MTEQEMYERSFQRPTNFFSLSLEIQWQIDKDLGILDWKGENLSAAEYVRYVHHYEDDVDA